MSFDHFTEDVCNERDFFNYFANCCFLMGDGTVGAFDHESRIAIYDPRYPRRAVRYLVRPNSREIIQSLRKDPSPLSFPRLGYYTVGQFNLIYRAVADPQDRLSRGFSHRRVSSRAADECVRYMEGVHASPAPEVSQFEAFAALHGLTKPRYQSLDDGLGKMFDGEQFGFVINNRTAVVMSFAEDSDQFPCTVLYNGLSVGKIDLQKRVHLVGDDDPMYSIFEKEVA